MKKTGGHVHRELKDVFKSLESKYAIKTGTSLFAKFGYCQ